MRANHEKRPDARNDLCPSCWHGKAKMKMVHVLFSIEEWDENGIPRKVTLRGNDEVIDMEKFAASGSAFMTAYIPAVMQHPENAGKKIEKSV
jgi:hypothetical protein